MKNKIYHALLAIVFAYGLISILTDFSFKAFYQFMPLSFWVEFENVELVDMKEGNFQILYSTRRVQESLHADFSYKTECKCVGGKYKTSSEWFFTQKDVLLPNTHGEIVTKEVDMKLPYSLLQGQECRTFITIVADIHGHERLAGEFTSYYSVL
jgi:hypothetical protein